MLQLLSVDPPLALPHNHKRKVDDGWSMLDADDFVVHIVSRVAREKYFPAERRWKNNICMSAIRVSSDVRNFD